MYGRVLDGKVLTIGVSGKLWRNALVMYDRQTNSLWSHFTGECIKGTFKGKSLEIIAGGIPRVKFGEWKKLHPNTKVLSVNGEEDMKQDSYSRYHKSRDTGIVPLENRDGRLGMKEMVIGVWKGDVGRAYPYTNFKKTPLIQDTFNGEPVLLYRNPETEASAAWYRTVKEEVIEFESELNGTTIKDKKTGSTWDLLTGKAIEGPMKGEQLTVLKSVPTYWFAWQDFYPDTTIYGTEGGQSRRGKKKKDNPMRNRGARGRRHSEGSGR